MSGGDRGGVGALNALIKKTRVGHRFHYTHRDEGADTDESA
jgi:hypothetical protein